MTFWRPTPAKPGFANGKVLPEHRANPLSRLFFSWLTSLLYVGYTRPLEAEDLWTLPDDFQSSNLADKFEQHFYARCPPEKRPPQYRALPSKKVDESLFQAYHLSLIGPWWVAGILRLASDTIRTTTPLVSKVFLTWLVETYFYHRYPSAVPAPRGVGFGIGVAFAIFLMQEAASLMENHSWHISMTLGMHARSGTIAMITRKSLRLSPSSLAAHSAGQINTMIGGDTTRIDQLMGMMHFLWVSPIQLIIGIALLIDTLGYSALVGLGVIVLSMPLQGILSYFMFKARNESLKITDKRVRGVREILNSIRLVKLYAWEDFYTGKISQLRHQEVSAIRRIMLSLAGIISNMFFIPTLCIILSFITYALTGHDLNIATIFTAFQFFNALQSPLMFLPFVLSAMSDAMASLNRIVEFLTAEELESQDETTSLEKNAIEIDGSFVWVPAQSEDEDDKKDKEKKEGKDKSKEKKAKKDKKKAQTDVEAPQDDVKEKQAVEEEQPFELRDLQLSIPKGSFVAIVGTIGSGKSSVLQAIIGDMKRTQGHVKLSDEVAYVPQAAWIRNASVEGNITFGQKPNEERIAAVIQACALEHDLASFPSGLETEIGEKGINLSGGQKARISLARAAYSFAPIVLLDDPLSAVDAHVGEHIVTHCLLDGPLAFDELGQKRTRVLATHALGVTSKTDWIYVMDAGKIVEQGTYQDLTSKDTTFARLMREHGTKRGSSGSHKGHTQGPAGLGGGKDAAKALMQEEDREFGAVSWSVYAQYLQYAGGIIWAPWLAFLLLISQGANVASSIFLSKWTSRTIEGFSQGQYMAVYAGLGGAQAVFSYIMSYSFAYVGLLASFGIFNDAFKTVARSPVSFFDTTPTGRILSRFSKDMDTLDNELALILYSFLAILVSVLGIVVLVFYTFPYLGIIFLPLGIIYVVAATFYRRTSIEVKRLDSILRSALYASFNETLTGLSTIRAYKTQEHSTRHAETRLDIENRAYYMTIVIQRWLGLRLELFGNFIILGIGLFAVGLRNSVDPSKVGLVLSYALGITQLFTEIVTQFATTEQNMNAVERLLAYTQLPSEAAKTTPDDPPASWPQNGSIKFQNVELAYRPGLPLVLKGVRFEVKAGEKIGIVGRTGAGKSSLLQALYRTVEVNGGTILIDDVDISKIGLDTLRSRLALVPQDSTLFFGTLRDNIDPTRSRTDAELITVLQRAWLLPSDGTAPSASIEAKFSLDSVIGDDGSNYSAGEKQLLALARALVKDSRIIVLDEATSSVDVETDAKIQRTIRKEFVDKTLLCIAHRLNTILYYDRILVMSEGRVVEIDSVLNLFENEHSVFRSLCDEAGITKEDIVRIRAQA